MATRARKRKNSFLIIVCNLQLIIRDEQFAGKGTTKFADVQIFQLKAESLSNHSENNSSCMVTLITFRNIW